MRAVLFSAVSSPSSDSPVRFFREAGFVKSGPAFLIEQVIVGVALYMQGLDRIIQLFF